MRTQSSELNARNQNVYIGLDVHLKQWNVCIYQGGILRKTFPQTSGVDVLLSHLRSNYPGMNYYSAYEAGVCGLSVHYALEDAGIHNIVFNAADIAEKHKERMRKTDKSDAKKIARALYNNELDCIHIPPRGRAADRNLLRVRQFCVDDVKRSKVRLRHFLHTNGIAIPKEFINKHWTKAFFLWLEAQYTTELADNSTAEALRSMTQKVRSCQSHLAETEDKLKELIQRPDYAADYALLRGIPGIGHLTAVTLLLECGDLKDFPSAQKFCAFVGLVPDIHQSDEHSVRCGITRRRHKTLRYMLTEAAWRAVAKDDNLSKLFAKYSQRMAKPKAIVKIANKLAKIITFVLHNKTAYVSTPN